jgi:hypothetical protein
LFSGSSEFVGIPFFRCEFAEFPFPNVELVSVPFGFDATRLHMEGNSDMKIATGEIDDLDEFPFLPHQAVGLVVVGFGEDAL